MKNPKQCEIDMKNQFYRKKIGVNDEINNRVPNVQIIM